MREIIRTADAAIAHAYLSVRRERNALRSFLFHSLFRDEDEAAGNSVNPLQRTTVGQFRKFIQYYQSHGYRFVRVSDLLSGLDPAGNYALITFDDGYFNNTRAIPILEELDVPAAFFITSDNVQQQKCFWWDVHWRENIARGLPPDAVVRDGRTVKGATTEDIEADLRRKFGAAAFQPRGEVDRPMTPSELREFARNKYVEIGNHTANHAILTNYSNAGVVDQVGRAQEAIETMTGVKPDSIAYPNGGCSESISDACRSLGLRCGFTVRGEKTALPVDQNAASLMLIGRFTPHDRSPIEQQCRTYRSDFQLSSTLHEGYRRLTRPRQVVEAH